MGGLWPYDDVRWRWLDLGFVLVTAALLIHSVLVWRGVLGDGTAWRPLSAVLLCAALLLQALGRLMPRSRAFSYTLLAASIVALAASALAR